jgi:integrase
VEAKQRLRFEELPDILTPNDLLVSGRTVRHVHETLRNSLNWGVRRELLSRNVADLVSDDDLPKVVKPKPVALTEEEVRDLLKEAKSPTGPRRNAAI